MFRLLKRMFYTPDWQYRYRHCGRQGAWVIDLMCDPCLGWSPVQTVKDNVVQVAQFASFKQAYDYAHAQGISQVYVLDYNQSQLVEKHLHLASRGQSKITAIDAAVGSINLK